MRVLVARLGPMPVNDMAALGAEFRANGVESVDIVECAALAEDVDAVLAGLDEVADFRLVLDADLAGLNLALTRLRRLGQLDWIDTAVLPRVPVPYLTRCGVPRNRAAQVRLAVTGVPRLVGVIKDDSGGLAVDSASMVPWVADEPWWVRAVVDDERLCDGSATGVRVRRLSPLELAATVQLGRLRKRTVRGRSLQLACDPACIVTDGIVRDQPRSKRTFWSEPKLWRLACPSDGSPLHRK